MCMSLIWWDAHPSILCLVLFNRDEVLNRWASLAKLQQPGRQKD